MKNEVTFTIGLFMYCLLILYVDKEILLYYIKELETMKAVGIILLFNLDAMILFRMAFAPPRPKTKHEILREELRGKDD